MTNSERDPLREALAALVAKLDECRPHITAAFQMQQIHGVTYNGPTYDRELVVARAALAAPPEPETAAPGGIEWKGNYIETPRKTFQFQQTPHGLESFVLIVIEFGPGGHYGSFVLGEPGAGRRVLMRHNPDIEAGTIRVLEDGKLLVSYRPENVILSGNIGPTPAGPQE